MEPIRYSVVVLTKTELKLRAEVHQNGLVVGSEAYLTAQVSEYGLPVEGDRVRVFAEVEFPGGGSGVLELSETFPGRFQAKLECTTAGIHHFRIRARGKTAYGSAFHREFSQAIRIQRAHDAVQRQTASPPDPTLGAGVDALLDESDALAGDTTAEASGNVKVRSAGFERLVDALAERLLR